MHTIKLGKYRHYKGKEYVVLGVATHSETLEQMVVYKANYGNEKIWVRPADMWNDIIDQNNTQRFTYIGGKDADN